MTNFAEFPFSRRQVIAGSMLAGAAATLGSSSGVRAQASGALPRPSDGRAIPVAFLMDQGANVMDHCGPWEVFQDADRGGLPGFELFTVAPRLEMIRATGGLQIMPHYSLDNAPEAKVILFGAQASSAENFRLKREWLLQRAPQADVIMSVCTGAPLLAATGLVDGLTITTHHDYIDRFEAQYPRVRWVRQRRYVENGKFMSAGGLTSGIDGALRIVERYYGRDIASQTADYMEYESRSWIGGAAGNS